MPRSRPVAAALVLLSAALAWQPARADDVDVDLNGTALLGKARPGLLVHVHAPLAGLALELERSDGAHVRQSTGRVGAGVTKTFDLDQPAGTFHYTGRLTVKFPKGAPKELPLDFDASLYGPPTLSAKDDAVDLAKRRFTITMDREPASIHVKVFGDDGAELADYDQKTDGVKAGEPIVSTWEQPENAVVLRVSVRATDRNGFYRDLDLYPWNFEIPHEDVLFDSGKSDIIAAEKPKLEAAYSELAKAVSRFGKVATVQLFVAGYTDTVGDAASNEALSQARALAIARYFKQKGVRIGIHYAGLGERGLLVATADETDEPRNRRATYTVSVEPPRGVSWTRLP